MAMIGNILVGSAIAMFAYLLINLLTDDQTEDENWRYDLNRMRELKQHSLFYRFMFPLFQILSRANRKLFKSSLPEIARQISAAGLSRYWLPEEYLSRMQIISLLLLPVYGYVCINWIGIPGLFLAIILSGLTLLILRRRLASQAIKRLRNIKQQLPFLLDLLTLQMEAGAMFLNALKEAVVEFRGSPIGEEFGRFLGELNMGKSRLEGLNSLRKRLQDDEITSVVGSIIQGETLGTPLTSLFRTQADILRLKRSQRAEALAAEAGVKMLLPAVLVMASTIIIILGPFLLSFIYSGMF